MNVSVIEIVTTVFVRTTLHTCPEYICCSLSGTTSCLLPGVVGGGGGGGAEAKSCHQRPHLMVGGGSICILLPGICVAKCKLNISS